MMDPFNAAADLSFRAVIQRVRSQIFSYSADAVDP